MDQDPSVSPVEVPSCPNLFKCFVATGYRSSVALYAFLIPCYKQKGEYCAGTRQGICVVSSVSGSKKQLWLQPVLQTRAI